MHEAYTVRHGLSATISVLHVKSHQDEITTNPNTLSLPAQLNIMADLGTHQAYKDCPHFQQTPLLPFTQAALILNRSRVTSRMSTQVTQAYYNPIMQEYFHKKFGWDTATFHNIDWDASEKSTTGSPRADG